MGTLKRYWKNGILFLMLVGMGVFITRNVDAAISNVSISNGTDTAGASATISPDNDGTKDRAKISWTSDAQGNARVTIDTNGTSGFQPITDWGTIDWQTDTHDWTMELYSGASDTVAIEWEGRDNTWKFVPNGTYNIRIEVDQNGDWTGADYVTNETLTVTVSTAGISGQVTSGSNPVSGAEVNAGNADTWSQAKTDSNGNYTIYGLRAGSYHVDVSKSGYVSKSLDNVSVSANSITTGQNFSLLQAVQLTGTITLSNSFTSFADRWNPDNTIYDIWININAWSETEAKNGWGNAHIHATDWPGFTDNITDTDGDGVPDTSESTTSVTYTVDLQPGTYSVKAEAEGFASTTQKDITVAEVTGGTLNLTMSKASRISGTVQLPDDVTQSTWVNISVSSSSGEAWGGGQVVPDGDTNPDTAAFDIMGVLPGTYSVDVRVDGYKPKVVQNVVVTSGSDTDLGTLTIESGSTISGTVTISGDTTGIQFYGGDPTQDIGLWINTWSTSTTTSNGVNVSIPRGVDKSVSYTIGGLDPGVYQVSTWLEGYEQSPFNLTADVSSTNATGVNITMAGFTGAISGTVTGFSNASKVVVTSQESGWGDWNTPKRSAIDSNGNFTISGIGTGFYMVSANQYVDPNADPLVPDGNLGLETEKVDVTNGKTVSGITLALKTGGTIKGNVTLTSNNGWTQADLTGQPVNCFPIEQQMMGGSGEDFFFNGTIDVNGNYEIKGLAAGVYVVEITQDIGTSDDNGQKVSAGVPDGNPDIAVSNVTVNLTEGETKTGVNLTAQDGYSISGVVTVPQAPVNDFSWIGSISADALESKSGSGISIMGNSFNGGTSYRYKITHIPPGNYVISAWSDIYVPVSAEVEITNADVSNINLDWKKGANIIGRLVNANTGEAVTAEQHVMVMCEADPWVEGSWRGTYSGDPTSSMEGLSYIETQEIGGTPGKFHLTNVPAGSYIIRVQNEWGERTDGTKNYANATIAGIKVSQSNVDNNQDVDIGTVKLKEGVTISGTVTDANGTLLANIKMGAEPQDLHDGDFFIDAETKSDGTWTLYGIDPDIPYWTVVAADRWGWMEDIDSGYGEEWKENVVPNATGVDFQLETAGGVLSGTISKAESDPDNTTPFSLPSFEEEEMGDFKTQSLPQVFLLLQKQGEILTDPMDGIEGASEPSDTNTTTFTISNIVSGTYTLKAFCPGFATAVINDITIATGDNIIDTDSDGTADPVQLIKGGTVTGSARKPDGTKPSSNDVVGVVAITEDFSNMVFGEFTKNDTTKEISDYTVTGLLTDTTYLLVFFSDKDDIWVMPDRSTAWTVTSAGPPAQYSYNAVIELFPPQFVAQAGKKDNGSFDVSIFSSTSLNDTDTRGTLELVQLVSEGDPDGVVNTNGLVGNVSILDNPDGDELFRDKTELAVNYTPLDATDTSFIIRVTGHNTEGNAGTEDLTFFTTAEAMNQATVKISGANVSLGGGNATSVYYPQGSFDDADNDGKTECTIEKLSTTSTTQPRLAGAEALSRSGVLAATPTSAISNQYEVTSGETVASGSTVTIALQCNSAPTANSNVYYYDSSSGYWKKEDTNRTVDTTNNKISVSSTHFSTWVVLDAVGPSAPASPAASGLTGKIRLSWTAASGGTGYNVYRSTTSGSGYTKINSSEVTGTTYEDIVPVSGTTYYYVIKGVDNTIPAESSSSSEVNGSATEPSTDSTSGGGGCFIATAAYGTPMASEVLALCDFRDVHLLTNPVGRRLVAFYYRVSPPIADFIAKHESLKSIVRFFLKPVVKLVE